MNRRFKPIGGMFQGVRGNTADGGTEFDAAKLAKLDETGHISDEMLNADVRVVAEGVAELDIRMTHMETESIPELEGRVSSTQAELESTAENLGGRIDELVSKVSATELAVRVLEERAVTVEERVSEDEARLADAEAQIADTSADLNDLNDTVQANKGDADVKFINLENRVRALEDKTVQIDAEMDDQRRLLDDIARSLADYGSSITNLSLEVSTLKGSFNQHVTDNQSAFSSVNSQLITLKARVDDIYDRLVNCPSV